MRLKARNFVCLALIMAALPALALTPGTEVLVPAAGRGGAWVTDLYIMNPGTEAVAVGVGWLVRGQANDNPVALDYTIAGGETLVLTDVIKEEFEMDEGNGAFLVVGSDTVVVNSRIYAADGDATFGQGFEGVPTDRATLLDETADVVGLAVNASFRTNFYACAGAEGASMALLVVDPDGVEIASGTKNLRPWEPFLQRINNVLPTGEFDDGTLRVTVTAGSAVVGASKVDNASTDPTTLESSVAECSAEPVVDDGTYQFAIYDSLSYATGGNFTISADAATGLNGTYTNWDKLDNAGDSACKWILLFGAGFPTPTTLADLAEGVTFADDYRTHGLGIMTWTLKLDVVDGMYLSGTIDAVGSDFPSDVDGCNGTYPTMTVYGGKMPAQ